MTNDDSSLLKRFFCERPTWIESQELWYIFQAVRFLIPLFFAWWGSRIMRDAPAPSLLLATLAAIIMFVITFVIVNFLFKLVTQTVDRAIG